MRWCTILGAISAALLALALSRTNRLPFAAALALALMLPLVLTFGGDSLFRQYCQKGIAIPGLVADFYNGTSYDPFDVYVPFGADPKAVQHFNPAAWLADSPNDAAPPVKDADYSVLLARRLHFEVHAPVPRFLVLSLRDYPAWRISINGVPATSRPHREDGLIVLPIASGTSSVNITYAHTRDETAGWILSGISVLALGFISRKQVGSAKANT
jgi:hypothetical protein